MLNSSKPLILKSVICVYYHIGGGGGGGGRRTEIIVEEFVHKFLLLETLFTVIAIYMTLYACYIL